jgi:hypothetical protein
VPIPPEDVVAAYELILGRPPEHAGIVALHAGAHDSRASLGASLMASGEAQGGCCASAARTTSCSAASVCRRTTWR